MTSTDRQIHRSLATPLPNLRPMKEQDLRHSKAFSLLYTLFKDSLKSASEAKIYRIICDTEEKDGRNHIYFEFLRRKETQNKEQIVIKNEIPGWPGHTSFG